MKHVTRIFTDGRGRLATKIRSLIDVYYNCEIMYVHRFVYVGFGKVRYLFRD